MKALCISVLSVAIFSSAVPFELAPPVLFQGRASSLSCYEIAEIVTGAPSEILHAIAIVESGEDDGAVGDEGRSHGRFQINETFHAERARLYGEYDPNNATQAAIIAGRIYVDNLARLGNIEKAIAAHRQGVKGVRRNGATAWYLERVYSNLNM